MGAGRRLEASGEVGGELTEVLAPTLDLEAWAGDDVAHDVAAGTEGGHDLVVEAPRQRPEVALAHAVELHRLAGGEPDAPVGELAGDLVERQPLLRAEAPPGDGHTDHEDVVEGLPGKRAGSAEIPVVLSVDAMEIEQLLAALRDLGLWAGELRMQVAPEQLAVLFDPLDTRQGLVLAGHVGSFSRIP